MSLLVVCRHVAGGDDGASLAARVRAYEPEAVYSSPLERARRTADAIGLPVSLDDRLREIDFGDVEGLGFDELPADLRRGLLEEPTRVRFPGGETYEELRVRVAEALNEIFARHDRAAVVTHAGAIRAAFATWLMLDERAIWRIDQRYGALNLVELVEGTPIVRLLNG
ncbi:MAG: histidine phosphatase family protein [Gaiellaceae bacterium]